MYKRILIIENAAIRDRPAYVPHKADKGLCQVAGTAAAPIAIHDARPGLMLPDRMPAGLSALDLARRLRHDKATADMPIPMPAARGSGHRLSPP